MHLSGVCVCLRVCARVCVSTLSKTAGRKADAHWYMTAKRFSCQIDVGVESTFFSCSTITFSYSLSCLKLCLL